MRAKDHPTMYCSALEHLATARSAYARFVRLADQADLQAPTRLSGWNISDLVSHVSWGMGMEAAALEGGAPGSGGEASIGLAAALSRFERASSLKLADDATVALPAAEVPMKYAAALFAFEAALHADDLAQAAGEDSQLSDAEVAACHIVIGPMLDLVAASSPVAVAASRRVEVDLQFLAEEGINSKKIRLSASEHGWKRSVPAPEPGGIPVDSPTTVISGDERSMILFVTGRRSTAGLQVTGDPVHARRFKEYFPGP